MIDDDRFERIDRIHADHPGQKKRPIEPAKKERNIFLVFEPLKTGPEEAILLTEMKQLIAQNSIPGFDPAKINITAPNLAPSPKKALDAALERPQDGERRPFEKVDFLAQGNLEG